MTAAHDGSAPPGRTAALVRYVGAATLARSPDVARGTGDLAGSVVVTARPRRGDADRALPVLATAVAVALVGVVLAPTVGSPRLPPPWPGS